MMIDSGVNPQEIYALETRIHLRLIDLKKPLPRAGLSFSLKCYLMVIITALVALLAAVHPLVAAFIIAPLFVWMAGILYAMGHEHGRLFGYRLGITEQVDPLIMARLITTANAIEPILKEMERRHGLTPPY